MLPRHSSGASPSRSRDDTTITPSLTERMRIAYCCHDSFPSTDTNTQQIFWTIAEVTRLDVAVDLTVPSVDVEGSADHRAAIAAYYGSSADAISSQFTITPVGDRRPASAMARGWFDWHVPAYLARRPYDLIWTRDPLAVVSCTRAGLPVVFETYRLDFATRARFRLWRRACLASPHLVGVIGHSRLVAGAFIRAGVPPDRCLVAHNGFASSLMAPRLDRSVARARLGLSGEVPLVVYAGHVGRKKGTDALVELAAAVPHARLLLLGIDPGSAEARRIDDAARAAGVGNLILRPRVPLSEVAPYLYAADCLVIPPTDAPLRRFGRTVLPMKVFMYLAAGRPILAPRLPDIEEVLTDDCTARLVSADNVKETCGALTRLLEDRALQDRLSRQALAAASHYTWAGRAKRIVEFFEHIHEATKTRRRTKTLRGTKRSS